MRWHPSRWQLALGASGWRRWFPLAMATLAFLAGTLFHAQTHRLPDRTPAAGVVDALLVGLYLWVGRGVIAAAWRNARRGRFFDEHFLMTAATVGAIALHQLPEASAVMLFYSVGESLQDAAVQRSRRSIRALLDLRPDHARVRRNGQLVQVPPDRVAPGEELVIGPGERIPLDGEVLEGESWVDTSALTGESAPRPVQPGDPVAAGTVNLRGLLRVRVTRPFHQSSVAAILRLVETAAERKAPTERFITRLARYYTPAVVAAAAAVAVVPPLVVPGAAWEQWIHRALVLLVISCPCALVVSVPLSYFAAIGAASRRGILVKGAHYLDLLTRLDTVVWDKTGTLTRGDLRVVAVITRSGFSPHRVLELAAHAEAFSHHPIAASLAAAYGRPVDPGRVSRYEELAGQGVRAWVDGHQVVVGSRRWVKDGGGADPQPNPPGDGHPGSTHVYVEVDGVPAGSIVLDDEIKPEAPVAIARLRQLGVRQQVMLTGDDGTVAQRVAAALGFDRVHANLLPEEKVAQLERLDARRPKAGRAGAIAFVGDGINDAPVLMRADVGVAMGGLGSDAAIEAADVVIMDDDPGRLATAVALARVTRRIVMQNIALALAIKGAFALLGAAGTASMWEAVFADIGVALLAILNATRILRAG